MTGLTLDQIRAVRDRHNIVEVLQRYGYEPPTRWNGSSDFMISCPEPNHDDRTPSCIVHPQTDRFYCFGCGARGDVLQLVCDVEGLRSLTDAARSLGGDTTRDPIATHSRRSTPATTPERTSAERILEINAIAWAELTTPAARATAHGYLRRRGIDLEPLEAQQGSVLAGYTPAARDGLVRYLRESGVTEDEIIDAGWARATEHGIVDRFHRRVLFPLTDPAGRLVGVTGRDITGVATRRYINTHTNPAFRKREALFVVRFAGAAQRSRHLRRPHGRACCCGRGSRRVQCRRSRRGTSLTEEHARRITGWRPRSVVLMPDGDPAGRAAGHRWKQCLAAAGVDAALWAIADGMDPATAAGRLPPASPTADPRASRVLGGPAI